MKDPDHPIWSILGDLVSYVPALICLVLITNKWDGEWLVLGALGAGAGGRAVLSRVLKGAEQDADA